jgi:hypothetical protein
MSKLETNQVDPATGTTLTLGTSGDTIAIPSGVTIANSGTATGFGVMTPAFHAFLSADQTISDSTYTTVQFNTEILDTGGCYDNSSTYRFTPTTAGKYYIYAGVQLQTNTASAFNLGILQIQKNGTSVISLWNDARNVNNGYSKGVFTAGIVDANGSSDYFQVQGYIDGVSGTTFFGGAATENRSSFGAYKIIE